MEWGFHGCFFFRPEIILKVFIKANSLEISKFDILCSCKSGTKKQAGILWQNKGV